MQRLPQIGEMAKVKHCEHSYNLPVGLSPGDTVKIISFDHGYYKVEREGRSYSVFMMCIDDDLIHSRLWLRPPRLHGRFTQALGFLTWFFGWF